MLKFHSLSVDDSVAAIRVASAFSRNLIDEIGEDNLRLAARENARRGEDGTCASHDHCDANMPMLEAFKAVMGRDPAILIDGAPEADVEADTAIWNAAWDIAKLGWPT